MTKREALREARKLWPYAKADRRRKNVTGSIAFRPCWIYRERPAIIDEELGAGRNWQEALENAKRRKERDEKAR